MNLSPARILRTALVSLNAHRQALLILPTISLAQDAVESILERPDPAVEQRCVAPTEARRISARSISALNRMAELKTSHQCSISLDQRGYNVSTRKSPSPQNHLPP